jgi:DNA-binding CsgD family transcriptional regulator
MLAVLSGDLLILPVSPPRPARPPEEGLEALRITREIDWPAGEAFVLSQLAFVDAARGEYGRAFEMGRSALAIAEEIGHRQWLTAAHMTLGLTYLFLCALAPARRHLEQTLSLARQMGSGYWSQWVTATLAMTLSLQGEFERADVLLAAVLAPEEEADTLIRRLCLRALGELALARGNVNAAVGIADHLLSFAGNSSDDAVPAGQWLLRGEAMAAAERWHEAEHDLGVAHQQSRTFRQPAMQWRSAAALARCLLAQGKRTDAERYADEARRTIDDISARVPDEAVEGIEGASLREAQLPARRYDTPARRAKREFGGLTAREREVAVMIGEGKSNAEIAATLVLGRRTIETHVSNILGKLGFSSRAQIAAWAVERRLSSEPPRPQTAT